MEIVYPSPQALSMPGFSITIPDGWLVDEAPDSLLVVAEPERSEFRANLTIAVSRVSSGTSLEEVLAEARLLLTSQYPDLVIIWDKTTEISGQPATISMASLQPRGIAFPIAQLQVLFYAPSGSGRLTRDLFRIYGSCRAIDADSYAGVFGEILASLQFEDTRSLEDY